jgi:hypothetical protein
VAGVIATTAAVAPDQSVQVSAERAPLGVVGIEALVARRLAAPTSSQLVELGKRVCVVVGDRERQLPSSLAPVLWPES